jgi:diketogulonate reductase-like aldo/keto reductase
MSKTLATTAGGMKSDLDRFRKELGVDYLDILLLHVQTAPDWNMRQRPVMDVITEAQEKGLVRTKGCSCHTLAALKAAAAEPWVEVDLARLNPAGLHMDADPATVVAVLKQMKAAETAISNPLEKMLVRRGRSKRQIEVSSTLKTFAQSLPQPRRTGAFLGAYRTIGESVIWARPAPTPPLVQKVAPLAAGVVIARAAGASALLKRISKS